MFDRVKFEQESHRAGFVVLPPNVWILVAMLAIVLGLARIVGGDVRDAGGRDERRSSLWPAVTLAIFGYLVAIATLAASLFLDVGVVVVLAVMAAASPFAISWYSRRLSFYRPYSTRPTTLSTSQLCQEWLESYDALTRAPSCAARLRLVIVRQRCLDELERRDPDGLRAWLASAARAGGNPRRFLTDPSG